MSEQFDSDLDCWAQGSFPLFHHENFGDWGTPRVQPEDTGLPLNQKEESLICKRLDSINDIKIDPSAPAHYNRGTKNRHRNSNETGRNNNVKNIVPKLAISQREIRKWGLNTGSRQLSSQRLVQDKDERNNDANKALKRITRSQSLRIFQEEQMQDEPIAQRESDDENTKNNEDAIIDDSILIEGADTMNKKNHGLLLSNGRCAKIELSRANSMPIDNESSDFKISPSRTKSEDLSGSTLKYYGEEHAIRRSGRRSIMIGGSLGKSEEERESKERRHKRSKSRGRNIHRSNEKSVQSKNILDLDGISSIEELEEFVKITSIEELEELVKVTSIEELEELVKFITSRNVEESPRRRGRRASMSGDTNHKKSERPSRRSSMSGGTNHMKPERPSRSSSMSGGTNHKNSERPSRSSSMSDSISHKKLERRSRRSRMRGDTSHKKSERPSRRFSMSVGTNQKMSERPSRSSSMSVGTNHKMSERPSRSSSMSVGTNHKMAEPRSIRSSSMSGDTSHKKSERPSRSSSMKSNCQNRRPSMSGGTRMDGSNDDDGDKRLTRKTSSRSSDELRQLLCTFHSKREDKLSLVNLMINILVPPESSASSIDSNYTISDNTNLSSSVTSEEGFSGRSQSTGDGGPSKGRPSRSKSNTREYHVSRSLRKKREDHREETIPNISKKDRKEKENKHTESRRRNRRRV